ncbi:kelch-like protein 21 [Denticeps clupeoides]|uniref:BTB domain-containing protein n=1 Tax=Denticeps clupeoides TaxID=299321 RepID=A0AAY4DU44_9TELE|nr:kelch-like protein 21 [Denticeps clupeoides]
MLARFWECVSLLWAWLHSCLHGAMGRGLTALTGLWRQRRTDDVTAGEGFEDSESGAWRSAPAARIYGYHDNSRMVSVVTSTHTFYVDLDHMADCSEYFRALSRSSMREASETQVCLDHVPSAVFHSLLEFCFHGRFRVADAHLARHLQVSSYLLATPFTARCVERVSALLTEHNCPAYLELSERLGCPELRRAALWYLSAHLLELQRLHRGMSDAERGELVALRSRGSPRLCCLRKENLSCREGPESQAARRLYCLDEAGGGWSRAAELPFHADKWCFTTAVLHNYLYLIGGYRHLTRRGHAFKMASFRYNPLTREWASTAPLIKHRRHFSAAACEGRVYAVGGWYLDSLASPDSSTSLYAAVERYDPWLDRWALVSPLPLSDFRFALSLSHDSPLTAALRHCLYVLGSVQATGEKLVLRYDARRDSWSELLPTLTCADANIPSLYFLGATDGLLVIGGSSTHTLVTTFCVESRKWGRIRATHNVPLIGQGTVLGDELYMSSTENIVRLNIGSLAWSPLPSLPVPSSYESLLHLHF